MYIYNYFPSFLNAYYTQRWPYFDSAIIKPGYIKIDTLLNIDVIVLY